MRPLDIGPGPGPQSGPGPGIGLGSMRRQTGSDGESEGHSEDTASTGRSIADHHEEREIGRVAITKGSLAKSGVE